MGFVGSSRVIDWLGGIPSMPIRIQDLTGSQVTEVAPFLQLLDRCHSQCHQPQHLHGGIYFYEIP